jgi:hypothetical protein
MKIAFFFLFCFTGTIVTKAQKVKQKPSLKKPIVSVAKPKVLHKAVIFSAECVCSSMEPKMAAISEEVFQIFEIMFKYNDKEAEKKTLALFSKLSEEKQESLRNELDSFDVKLADTTLGVNAELCTKEKMAVLTENELRSCPNEKQMEKEMLLYIETLPTCKRTAFVLRMQKK